MNPRSLLLVIFMTSLLCVTTSVGQQGITVPGAPKGHLPTELLQSRAYCRSMERSLALIEERFPSLSVEVLAAKASWKSSPFAIGCDAIEEDIINDAGETGRTMLKKLDEDTWAEALKHVRLKTVGDAREFLAFVDRRAKGEIEVPMVRGNLLWHYKPFQENPEKEIERGYVQKLSHTARIGRTISFQIPMSWKTEESPKAELMSFRNCYGHGYVWMTVLVSPTIDGFGQPISAQEKFDGYTEAALRTEYRTLGIELTSFLKTKVNGMPALLFTREQPYEQLGQKATRAAEVIRVFSGDHMISFQINTLGPEGEKTASKRIFKNEPLFKMIGGSLRVID